MYATAALALPLVAYGTSRLAGEAALRADDRVTAATRLRRVNRLLQVAVALTGVVALTVSPVDDAVAAATPGPAAVGAFTALAGTVIAGGFLPAVAVHLGTRPALAAVTGNPADYVASVRRYTGIAALVVGPAFVVVAAWLVAPSGLPGLVAVAVSSAVIVAALPPIVARFGPVRRPNDQEAAIVPPCASGLRVRVVETNRHTVANAVAMGVLPGARYVFVTDALVRTLDADAAAAVVAHEAGHHRRHHVEGRLGASAVALAPLFLTATGVVDAFLPAVALSAVLLVAVGPLVRWTEFDADAYAARHVGAAAMECALATLADRGLVAVDRSRVFGALALHPSIGRRVERLRRPHGF